MPVIYSKKGTVTVVCLQSLDIYFLDSIFWHQQMSPFFLKSAKGCQTAHLIMLISYCCPWYSQHSAVIFSWPKGCYLKWKELHWCCMVTREMSAWPTSHTNNEQWLLRVPALAFRNQPRTQASLVILPLQQSGTKCYTIYILYVTSKTINNVSLALSTAIISCVL